MPVSRHDRNATSGDEYRHTRDTGDPLAAIEEMGVFESIPALPFLVAAAVHAVYAVLPKPLDRGMCHGLGRVLPADYVCELTSTLQSATGRINRDPHTYCGYCRRGHRSAH